MSKVIANPDSVVVGKEPVWLSDKPCSTIDLVLALNWYSYSCNSSDSKKYLLAHLKRNKTNPKEVDLLSEASEDTFSNIGFLARMLDRGLNSKNVSKRVAVFVTENLHKLKKTQPKKSVLMLVSPTKKLNIQDFIAIKARAAIGEIEGSIDDSDYSKERLDGILEDFNIKAPAAKHIVEWAENRAEFVKECIGTKDAELKEAYSHLTKKDLKNYCGFLELVVQSCKHINVTAKATRKPRKKKVKVASVVVKAIKYLKSDAKLKINSINPEEIVGASQLWVFNVKTRKLGVYNSDGGLTMKGTTLQNFDEATSMQKTVRKPEEKLPIVITAGKVVLRKLMPEIKAVESFMTGRINKDTLLLKVVNQ